MADKWILVTVLYVAFFVIAPFIKGLKGTDKID